MGEMYFTDWPYLYRQEALPDFQPLLDLALRKVPEISMNLDAASKYHVISDLPATRHLVAVVAQFQIFKAACQMSGHQGQLHTCHLDGSLELGNKLKKMLQLGNSRPWPDILEMLTGSRTLDAGPLLEFFQQLYATLQFPNGYSFGWTPPCSKMDERFNLARDFNETEVGMAESRDYEELLRAWEGWRDATGPKMKDMYAEFVELQTEAVKLQVTVPEFKPSNKAVETDKSVKIDNSPPQHLSGDGVNEAELRLRKLQESQLNTIPFDALEFEKDDSNGQIYYITFTANLHAHKHTRHV
ncbi:angiotensin-converting enzyme-like [Physella acuta]|uniref:angiotensin-converting enzyme-like n=1 Tax=Physella acuta TaxID=109671 RepID=UPI0027DE2471|nr:angiotensin-converting enzyme-like [Physella acuta]